MGFGKNRRRPVRRSQEFCKDVDTVLKFTTGYRKISGQQLARIFVSKIIFPNDRHSQSSASWILPSNYTLYLKLDVK
jgi:hypothetical protein